jgi:transposase-like protein
MNQESQNSMTNTKTRQQIAQEYGVTPKTLKSWLY